MRYFDSEDSMNEGKSGMDPQLGHVRGKVLDMDGNGVRHSRVWIRETGRSIYTDRNGNFVIINVVPALYTLIAESEGFAQSVMPDMPVISGDNPGFLFVMYPNYNRHYNRSRVGSRRGALTFHNGHGWEKSSCSWTA
jgi:hypothetical protein